MIQGASGEGPLSPPYPGFLPYVWCPVPSRLPLQEAGPQLQREPPAVWLGRGPHTEVSSRLPVTTSAPQLSLRPPHGLSLGAP